jgi:hypothetical protein
MEQHNTPRSSWSRQQAKQERSDGDLQVKPDVSRICHCYENLDFDFKMGTLEVSWAEEPLCDACALQ